MNKRGQVYILAAIVLVIAVYGVIKITNKIEPPRAGDNFDFYVENFVGERAYVMDLGYLQSGPDQYLVPTEGGDNLLELFTSLGFNVGVVLVSYKKDVGWKVINYLSQNIETSTGESTGEENSISLPPAQESVAGLSFSLSGEGKQFYLDTSKLGELGSPQRYFIKEYPALEDEVVVYVDGNQYDFGVPSSDQVESLIFKNLDENYVKVVKV
tara:strand:- start:8076 stop:8711 length:636 start_codon:yes stop_codon:yes gene_type:complete